VQNAQAAGCSGAVVFNRTGFEGCDALLSMLVEADIPAVFVSRTDGFRILTGAVHDGYACNDVGGTAVPTAVERGQRRCAGPSHVPGFSGGGRRRRGRLPRREGSGPVRWHLRGR
jgi:hypothetical protein